MSKRRLSIYSQQQAGAMIKIHLYTADDKNSEKSNTSSVHIVKTGFLKYQQQDN